VPELDADPAWRLAAAFLLGYRGHTRRAYFADIRAWYTWCAGIDMSPMEARRHHVDRWIAEQVERPQPTTGRPVAAATVARRLSCLAGLYEYAVVDVGLIDASPVVRVKRPRVSDRSSTIGLIEAELIALLGAAEADDPRSAALITLLALNGLRVGEALALDAPDLSYDFGHRVLTLTRKGGKRSVEALAPATVRALETYLADRTAGPDLPQPGWRPARRTHRVAAHPAPGARRRYPRREPAQPPQPAAFRHHRSTERRRPVPRRPGLRRPRRPPHHPAV
jgi:integrase/recombinase XerD